MSNTKTKRLVGIALLSAVAFVLALMEIPLLPTAPFLKLDFSDIAVFIGMYIFGPLGGTAVAFIRSLLQYITTGGDAGFPIGATAAFIASISVTLPIYFMTVNYKTNLKNKVIAAVIASVSLTIVLAIVNWLFVLPAYLAVMGFEVGPIRDYMLFALVPFNLIKGGVVSTAILILYEKMKPWLNKARANMSSKDDINHYKLEN